MPMPNPPRTQTTNLPPVAITRGFQAAAALNLGILVASRGLSGSLGAIDPLFSPVGCLAVVLWGLAYGAVAKTIHHTPRLAWVFALEKLLYGGAWAWGLTVYGAELSEASWDVALFFRTYGLADLGFAGFFGWSAWKLRRVTSD